MVRGVSKGVKQLPEDKPDSGFACYYTLSLDWALFFD